MRDERSRRIDLAGAVGDAQERAAQAAAAAQRVALARHALDVALDERDRLLARGGPAAALAHHERYIGRRRRELADALDEQLRADAIHRGQLDAVDADRARLVRARADREVIERHFAAWRTERRKLAERRDD
jgi:hypothetical protein